MDNSNLINKINAVEGFDPTPYAVDYTDLNTGETRKRLPVMAQMAWFRLKYPEGRIAVQVAPGQSNGWPRNSPATRKSKRRHSSFGTMLCPKLSRKELKTWRESA